MPMPQIGQVPWGEDFLETWEHGHSLDGRHRMHIDLREYNPDPVSKDVYTADVIQTALDEAATYPGAVIAVPSQTTWLQSTTLDIREGVSIEGGVGGGGVGTRPPEIAWIGTEGGVQIRTDPEWAPGGDGTARVYMIQMKRLVFRRASGHDHYPGVNVQFNHRCDSGTTFEDVWFRNASSRALEFLHGGINVHFKRGNRFDWCKGYAIYWKISNSGDDFSLSGFEYDNDGTNGGGGLLHIDGSTSTGSCRAEVTNAKLEVNKELPAGESVILLSVNPEKPYPKNQIDLETRMLWAAPASGVEYEGIKVDPPSDYVRVHLGKGTQRMTVHGIPSYRSQRIGSSSQHTDTLIIPQSKTADPIGGSSDHVARITVGDHDHMGYAYQFGQFEAPFLHATTTPEDWDEPANLKTGMMLLDKSSVGTAALTIHAVTGSGTMGVAPAGVTANGTQGETTATFSSVEGFSIDQRVRLNGSGSYRILHIDGNTNTVTFSGSLSENLSGAAVTYRLPTFKTYSMPEVV